MLKDIFSMSAVIVIVVITFALIEWLATTIFATIIGILFFIVTLGTLTYMMIKLAKYE
jgi:hypothetical protein